MCIKWNSKVVSGLSHTLETVLSIILDKTQEMTGGSEALKYLEQNDLATRTIL